MTVAPSPCATCISDAPCPCPAFVAWDDLTHPEPRPCLTCVEVDHFVCGGDDLHFIAARLGITRDSLVTHLKRHGRDDLLPRKAYA